MEEMDVLIKTRISPNQPKFERLSSDQKETKRHSASIAPDLIEVDELKNYMKSDEDLRQEKKKGVKLFYKNQNEIIEGLIDIYQFNNEDTSNAELQSVDSTSRVKLLVNLSFFFNVGLLIIKILAAISSGSMSVVASAADSLLDLLSGAFMMVLARKMGRYQPYKYPESKVRLEPLGIIIFASIMGMTSLQIIREAIGRFSNSLINEPYVVHLDWLNGTVLGLVIIIKLVLYFVCQYCNTSDSGIVTALQDDHRNDVATNTIAVVAAVVAAEWPSLWMVDCIGAILFGTWILVSWVQAGKEQIGHLVGRSAPSSLIGKLAYMAGTHDKRILRVDTVRAFHFGEHYLAEVDIVLDETMALREAHDIGENLQIKIEKLPAIQRAYVHLDYEWQHKPEH